MCRYASVTYKSHFACLSCRKAFKKTPIEDYLAHHGLRSSYEKIVAVHAFSQRRKEVEAKLGVSYDQLVERYTSS